MIIQPSGTILVKKVDENNNFKEDSLDYFDLQSTLSANLVTITGTQTISGAKTFNLPLTVASGITTTSGRDLGLSTSGAGTAINLIVDGFTALGVNPNNWMFQKSHETGPGDGTFTITSGIQTTNNDNVIILSNVPGNNTATWLDVWTIGIRTSGSNRVRMTHMRGAVYVDNSGVASLVGTVDVIAKSVAAGTYSSSITVSGAQFNVIVNGDAAETVNWVCKAQLQKVGIV